MPSSDSPLPSQKRKKGDTECTRHNFFDEGRGETLTDLRRFQWALQTEDLIRLEKLQNRNRFDRYPQSLASCPYLIDLYPAKADEGNEEVTNDVVEVDMRDIDRECIKEMRTMRTLDNSMDAHKMDTGSRRQSHLCIPHVPGDEAIPPTLWHFKIILEGFMGYKVGLLRGSRQLLPRWAVMGGAVVAALTAWRKEGVRRLFEESDLDNLLLAASFSEDDRAAYEETKEGIVRQINLLFMYGTDPSDPKRLCYPQSEGSRTETIAPDFSESDVDIFLQASEQTFRLQRTLWKHLPREVLSCIEEFVGETFVKEDLRRFADSFLARGRRLSRNLTYAYALAQNSLSFMACLDVDDFGTGQYRDTVANWPRSTQLIMLKEQADLTGGLADFDISVTTCAHNADGVFIAPRAALSLLTNTIVVTPFVAQEKRNRQRILKYFRRGFTPYLVDAYCYHNPPGRMKLDDSFFRDGAMIYQVPLSSFDLHSLQRSIEFPDECVQACCRVQQLEPGSPAISERTGRGRHRYSLRFFEHEEGDAIKFFSSVYEWPSHQRSFVESVPKNELVACRKCRMDYALHLFLKDFPLLDGSSTNDILHGEFSYFHHMRYFAPSFYGGGVFDCKLVGVHARTAVIQLAALQAQSMAEKARRFWKLGPDTIKEDRFIFGTNHEELFRRKARFYSSTRPPIGLNPERFIGVCENCQDYLLGCEYGTQYCPKCVV